VSHPHHHHQAVSLQATFTPRKHQHGLAPRDRRFTLVRLLRFTHSQRQDANDIDIANDNDDDSRIPTSRFFPPISFASHRIAPPSRPPRPLRMIPPQGGTMTPLLPLVLAVAAALLPTTLAQTPGVGHFFFNWPQTTSQCEVSCPAAGPSSCPVPSPSLSILNPQYFIAPWSHFLAHQSHRADPIRSSISHGTMRPRRSQLGSCKWSSWNVQSVRALMPTR
jgi:hypothetical protein